MISSATSWDAVTAFETWAVFLATAGLIGTGVWALRSAAKQINIQRELARIDNLEKQLFFFESEPFTRVKPALASARTQANGYIPLGVDDPPASMYESLNFFEHVGLLVKLGHLRARDVWHTFAYWAVPLYYDSRRLIEESKETTRRFTMISLS